VCDGAGACGGELACSTCHLIFEKDVFDQLPEISEEEEDMLDLAWGLTETYAALRGRPGVVPDALSSPVHLTEDCRSRLGCQIKVSKVLEGATVHVPDDSDNLM
jgi:ferredoxin